MQKTAAGPSISVVVPHYQDLQGLDLCLSLLERQTHPSSAFEIVVSDNNSPVGLDAVAAVVRDRARLVTCMQPGAGPARNLGVAHARGEILAFTDSDCQPAPDWLSAGVAALDRADFIGGKVGVIVDDPMTMTPVEAFESVFAFDNETYVKRLGFTVTANLFCRRDLFDRVGGFRVGVAEDKEWSHRARDLGFRIGYAERAMVQHPARRTWPELVRKWERLSHEAFGLEIGRPRWRLCWLLRTLALPPSALVHTPKALFSRDLRTVQQRWDACRVLWRLRLWRMGAGLRLLRTH